MNKRKWNITEIKILTDNYGVKRTVDIASTLNRTYVSVMRMANYLKLQHSRTKLFKNINHRYFNSIDSHEKAYLLGLISSDGCVQSNGCISFASKDYVLVSYVRDILTSDRIIERCNGAYLVRFVSKIMANDLFQYGVIPRKSYSFIYPHNMPIMFDNSFILGYFDGDGSLCFDKKYPKWILYGNKPFLKVVIEKISECLDVKIKSFWQPRKTTHMHAIQSFGSNACIIDKWIHININGLWRKRVDTYECISCGHIDKANRKSQSVFSCVNCGHSDHADLNAAKVIANRGRAAIVNQPYAISLAA